MGIRTAVRIAARLYIAGGKRAAVVVNGVESTGKLTGRACMRAGVCSKMTCILRGRLPWEAGARGCVGGYCCTTSDIRTAVLVRIRRMVL